MLILIVKSALVRVGAFVGNLLLLTVATGRALALATMSAHPSAARWWVYYRLASAL